MRDVALVVYGGILGWYLCKWWEREREYMAWSAAERSVALSAARTNGAEPAPPAP